jgi:hypothetical protein
VFIFWLGAAGHTMHTPNNTSPCPPLPYLSIFRSAFYDAARLQADCEMHRRAPVSLSLMHIRVELFYDWLLAQRVSAAYYGNWIFDQGWQVYRNRVGWRIVAALSCLSTMMPNWWLPPSNYWEKFENGRRFDNIRDFCYERKIWACMKPKLKGPNDIMSIYVTRIALFLQTKGY